MSSTSCSKRKKPGRFRTRRESSELQHGLASDDDIRDEDAAATVSNYVPISSLASEIRATVTSNNRFKTGDHQPARNAYRDWIWIRVIIHTSRRYGEDTTQTLTKQNDRTFKITKIPQDASRDG